MRFELALDNFGSPRVLAGLPPINYGHNSHTLGNTYAPDNIWQLLTFPFRFSAHPLTALLSEYAKQANVKTFLRICESASDDPRLRTGKVSIQWLISKNRY